MTDSANHDAAPGAVAASGEVRVWDPLVRAFHWSLVAAFTVAWLSAEEVSTVHEAAGYVVAGLVAFRMVWGLVGNRHARFAQFMKGPGETSAYLADVTRGEEPRYLGHNPAGAAIILALLATLSGTAFTGWLMENPSQVAMLPDLPQILAPARADDDGDEREYSVQGEAQGTLGEVHETLANLALLLAALHVGGVVLASFRHRENLARSMITGDKRAAGLGDIA